MLWFIFAAMAAIAVVFIVRPLLKSSQGLSVVLLLLTVMLVAFYVDLQRFLG